MHRFAMLKYNTGPQKNNYLHRD